MACRMAVTIDEMNFGIQRKQVCAATCVIVPFCLFCEECSHACCGFSPE